MLQSDVSFSTVNEGFIFEDRIVSYLSIIVHNALSNFSLFNWTFNFAENDLAMTKYLLIA